MYGKPIGLVAYPHMQQYTLLGLIEIPTCNCPFTY